jgi:hypothetical protein
MSSAESVRLGPFDFAAARAAAGEIAAWLEAEAASGGAKPVHLVVAVHEAWTEARVALAVARAPERQCPHWLPIAQEEPNWPEEELDDGDERDIADALWIDAFARVARAVAEPRFRKAVAALRKRNPKLRVEIALLSDLYDARSEIVPI